MPILCRRAAKKSTPWRVAEPDQRLADIGVAPELEAGAHPGSRAATFTWSRNILTGSADYSLLLFVVGSWVMQGGVSRKSSGEVVLSFSR